RVCLRSGRGRRPARVPVRRRGRGPGRARARCGPRAARPAGPGCARGRRVSGPGAVGARAGRAARAPARAPRPGLPRGSPGKSHGARRRRSLGHAPARHVSGVALMIKKVCQLLQHPRIERRCAAAMVLGELGDKAAAPALIGALSDGDPLVQLYALEALDRLGAGAQAAKRILPLWESHDDQVRPRAAAMLAGSGARAAEALRRELHPDTPIARRRTAVHVLAQQRSAAALDALLGAFADEALAEHALNALRAEIDGLEAKERKLIADRAEA